MGKIAQRISSRQSWAGKWADRVARLLRQTRRSREAADDAAAGADFPGGPLQEPIEELLSRADRREFDQALDLLYGTLSTQKLAEEADAFSLLLEDSAGIVYWEQAEGEAQRFGESQLFALGFVTARRADAPDPVLDPEASERLRRTLVDTHQVSARGRIVLLPLILPHADELEFDPWQERQLARGLQDWASAHPGEGQPDAEQARQILALAQHEPSARRAAGDGKGSVALRSWLVLGLIVPPGETVDGEPATEDALTEAPIGEYFPRREMAPILHDLLDAEEELEIVLELRQGLTPQDVDPEDIAELKALYADDRLVDLEADLEATRDEIEALRQEHPQLSKAVESEGYLDAYERKLAEVLAPVVGDATDPTLGVRYATEAGPLQEIVALTFEDHRLIGFEIGALLAARAAGRADCRGLLADMVLDEDGAGLEVLLFDGPRLVHETRWPMHYSESDASAADRLLEALDLLGIRFKGEAADDEAAGGGEDRSAPAETEVLPQAAEIGESGDAGRVGKDKEAGKAREERASSESSSRQKRRHRPLH